jgi:capsular polysaccharide biosynthesis protein
MTELTPRPPVDRPPVDRRTARLSIVVGAVVALLILVAGIAFAVVRPPAYTAEAMAVVLPGKGLDEATAAGQWETLSRGQIPATFAEVAADPRFQTAAADQLKLTPDQRQQIQVETSVVPNTSVILIRVTAPDPVVAEQMADATTALASQYLTGLLPSFRTETVQSAEGTAQSSGLSPLLLIVGTVVLALVAGLAVQQAIYHLLLVLRRGPASGGPTETATSTGTGATSTGTGGTSTEVPPAVVP